MEIYAQVRTFVCTLLAITLTCTCGAEGVVTACDQASLTTAMSGGGTVTFACDGTIILTNTITVQADTILDGTGRSVIISGNHSVRIFNVTTGATFTISHLTIANGVYAGTNAAPGSGTDGESAFGGAVFNGSGTLVLLSATVSNNVARGGHGGLDQSISGGSGGAAGGGAIYSRNGILRLTDTVFSGNQAIGGSGGFGVNDPKGGAAAGAAIFALDGSLYVTNCAFKNHLTLGGTNGWFDFSIPSPSSGPARGSAIFQHGSNMVLRGSVFFRNVAQGGHLQLPEFTRQATGGEALGGALFLSWGDAEIVDCEFGENRAVAASLPSRNTALGVGFGGAIFNQDGVVNIINCPFWTNSATGGSGSLRAGGESLGARYSTGGRQ